MSKFKTPTWFFLAALTLLLSAIGAYFLGSEPGQLGLTMTIAGIQMLILAFPLLISAFDIRFPQHLPAFVAAGLAIWMGEAWLVGWILGPAAVVSWGVSVLFKSPTAFDSRFAPSSFGARFTWILLVAAAAVALGAYFLNEGNPSGGLIGLCFFAGSIPAVFLWSEFLFKRKSAIEVDRHGITIKSEEAFDRISEITIVAFDKTGTLTDGRPVVAQMMAIENVSHRDLLSYAYSLESGIDHPFADAIIRRANEEKAALKQTKNLHFEGGKGIRAQVDWDGKIQDVVFGNLNWMYEHDMEPTEIPPAIKWEADGTDHTVLWMGVDKKVIGAIFLEDKIRDDARIAVQALMDDGYHVGIITGDSENAAKKLAKTMQLKFSHFGVVPKEKITLIRRLSEKKKKGFDFIFPKVAFVGDARNESPALKEAYLGIALGDEAHMNSTPGAIYAHSQKISAIPEVFSVLRNSEFKSNLWKTSFYAYEIVLAGGLGYLAHSGRFFTPAIGISSFLAMGISLFFLSQARPSNES